MYMFSAICLTILVPFDIDLYFLIGLMSNFSTARFYHGTCKQDMTKHREMSYEIGTHYLLFRKRNNLRLVYGDYKLL